MAEIPVQKKSHAWVWVLLALIALALLAWWAFAEGDDDAEMVDNDAYVVTDPVVPATPGADAEANAQAGLALGAILANPAQYYGQEYSGEVSVGDELTDRGFWIENNGERMFALIVDQPREVPIDINPGQRLRIDGGTVRNPADPGDIPGVPLDDDTRRILADQDAVLVVNEADIDILQS